MILGVRVCASLSGITFRLTNQTDSQNAGALPTHMN